MRLRRAVAVVLLVSLLSASVAAGNATIAAERTLLSGPFVKDTLAETGAYGTVRGFVIEQATAPPDPEAEDGGPQGPFRDASGRIVEEAVTEAYLRQEVERNVDRTYGYLHGDRERLVVAVDLEPVQDEITGIVAEEIRNESVGDLLEAIGGGDASLPVAGSSVNLSAVGTMGESPEAYESARTAFRADVRASVVDRLVDESYEAASNDERLALVIPDYDPGAYSDAEKAEMVEDRETAIRAATRERIEAERGDEIDAAVEDRLAALAAVDGDQFAAQLGGSEEEVPPGVAAPVGDLAATSVEALATDVPYETYVAETDDAKARLAANVTGLIEGEIQAQGTDELVVMDSRDPAVAGGLQRARTVVSVVDLLSVVLPLVSVALVGLLWWLTRSPAITVGGTGVGLLVGGLPGYVLATRAPALVAEALSGGELPPEAAGLVLGVVDRVLGVLAGQSLALVLVGAGFVAVAGYVHAYGAPAWALRVRASREHEGS